MNWPLVKLGDLCVVKRGTTITQKEAIEGKVPVVGGGLKPTYFHNSSNRNGNTITVSGSGASAGFINFYKEPIFASDCSTVEPKNDTVDVSYIYRAMQNLQEYIYTKLKAGAAQPHVYAKDLANLEIPLPPLAEQQRIAALLDAADRILKQRESAIAKLDELAQSVFVEMFGDSSKNPKNWKTEKLSSLIKSGDTINYGVIQPGSDFENGIPLVRAGDVGNRNLNLSQLKKINPAIEASYKRSRLFGDEILVSCVGLIGAVMLADKSMSGFNIARAVARISPSTNVNRIYLSEYLKTSKVQRYFVNELRTVAQPTLNIKQICETEVLCPPLTLQNDFEKIINKFDLIRLEYKKAMVKKLALLRALQFQSFAVN